MHAFPSCLLFVVVVVTAAATATVPWQDRIKHIVVLMEENQSFDHIFGWRLGVDGLTGAEFNLVDPLDTKSEKVFVSKNAAYLNECDPDHGIDATTFKLFGPLGEFFRKNETMSSFVAWERLKHSGLDCSVMAMFDNAGTNYHKPKVSELTKKKTSNEAETKKKKNKAHQRRAGVPEDEVEDSRSIPSNNNSNSMPVISALADEFVLFDRFFASLPGPTWPNRLFFMAGTSGGLVATGPWFEDVNGQLFPQKTIFDQVSEAVPMNATPGTLPWKVFYSDAPWELFVRSIALNPEHVQTMDAFYKDAAEGTLPVFSFINPRSGINMTTGQGSNDQHPDHDVRWGELLYKEVYEALRSSPQWNETLFVLTYDEHGGFYDHVQPPMEGIPAPDNISSYPPPITGPFMFNRLGLRIPTILISPWLAKGKVVSAPPLAQKPHPSSEYELTSIISTARKLLRPLNSLPALTNRDAWAATFEHLFSELDSPRTDCPRTLPDPPLTAATPQQTIAREGPKPLNGLQSRILRTLDKITGTTPHAKDQPHPHVPNQGKLSPYVQYKMELHKQRVRRWKKTRTPHRGSDTASSIYHPGEEEIEEKSRSTIRQQHQTVFKKNLVSVEENKKDGSRMRASSLPYQVVVKPLRENALAKIPWIVTPNINITQWPFMTISIAIPGDSVPQCLQAAPVLNATVAVGPCFPGADPKTNADPQQHWNVMKDATIRPFANHSLCVTNKFISGAGFSPLWLELCEPQRVHQHYAYHGPGGGESDSGYLYYGDCLNAIVVDATTVHSAN